MQMKIKGRYSQNTILKYKKDCGRVGENGYKI